MTNPSTPPKSSLPPSAMTSINHCNLPAEVLGDLSFQSNPKPLTIDGIAQSHKLFFQRLKEEQSAILRARYFMEYMNTYFRLENLDEAGYDATAAVDRSRANYLRILRGWFFDSDSVEGAVIKSWVESRFGLIPRYHQNPIRTINDKAYAHYVASRSRGLYNTNALEAQLDLLYSYCQYELLRQYPDKNSIVLYRGQNNFQSFEHFAFSSPYPQTKPSTIILLNNISSFSDQVERAGEFGDSVISVEVPFSKLVFYNGLMPGIMTSEKEYAVIGGLYAVNLVTELNRH